MIDKTIGPVERIDPKRKGDHRYYKTSAGKFPSATSILDIIAKPALIAWAANQERELVLATAVELYDDCLKSQPPLSTTEFSMTLEKRLPKQRQHVKSMSKAADIGNAVHEYIEYYLLTQLGFTRKLPVINPLALKATESFEKWAHDVRLVPLVVEATIVNTVDKYAGTMDAIVEIDHNGERILCVADWKTSGAIYNTMMMQVAAYAHADMADSVMARAKNLTDRDTATKDMHGLIVRFDKKQVGLVEPYLFSPEEVRGWYKTFKTARDLFYDLVVVDKEEPAQTEEVSK